MLLVLLLFFPGLRTPGNMSPLVLPICLPTSAVQLKNAISCWVTGWDNSGIFQSMTPPYTLKELKVHLIDLQTCKKYQKESLLRGVEPVSEAVIYLFPAPSGAARWVYSQERRSPDVHREGLLGSSRSDELGIKLHRNQRAWSIYKHQSDFSRFFPVMLLPLIFLGPP
ncbi:hypothetical protein CapIbe_014255 [Capra ibex]